MPESRTPPPHVTAAFGVEGVEPQPLPSSAESVWRYGDVVLQPVLDPVLTAWTAGVFESLRVSGIRVPRPVRSLDGRWVVGGWCGQRFLSGRVAPRYQEAIEASFAMDEALREVAVPRMLLEPIGLTGWADRLSWDPKADVGGRWGESDGATLWFQLAAGRRPAGGQPQVVHGDMFGHVLFAGSAPPAVVDFLPLIGPVGLSAAILAVDAVAWGGAAPTLADQGQRVAEWPEILRRACLFRLAFTLAHPRMTPAAESAVTTAVRSLRPLFA